MATFVMVVQAVISEASSGILKLLYRGFRSKVLSVSVLCALLLSVKFFRQCRNKRMGILQLLQLAALL